MRRKVVSTLICAMMILSGSVFITQNGDEPENVGQPQNNEQPSPTSGGSGGLADSPWPMFRQNLNHTGQSPYDTSGNNGQLKWSFEIGDYMLSSPAIGSDGIIYIGSRDNKLYAINPDGSERWSFLTGDIIDSSPAIDSDGIIYVGSSDWKLYAINPDGTEKWNFATNGSIESSPAIGFDGTIYVGSSDCKLYAINPDGTEKWSFITGKGISFSSAGIDSDGTIYIGSTDNKLYAVYPNGTEKWSFETGNYVISSPAIGFDGTIYVTSLDRRLYAINHDGSEKWNNYLGYGTLFSSPAIGFDGTIYVGSGDKKIYAINPDGTEKWNFTTMDHIFHSSPAIGSEGTIYIGSYDFRLYAINPDGTQKWNFLTGWPIEDSPTIGSDGIIYVGSSDGKLYAIGNSPSNLQIDVISHFSELNSAAQSAITVHVTDGTNPVQGATVNLDSDNGGIFSPQSGITDANGDFKSIFNAPAVTSQIICKISAEASKTGYNDGSGYVDVTINPIPWPTFSHNNRGTGHSPYDTSSNPGKLKWSFDTGNMVRSSPLIGSDETIYIGSADGNLYAVNSDGTLNWRFNTTSVSGIQLTSPTIDSDGTIYVGSNDKILYAINPDGTEKWNFTTGGGIKHSLVVGSDGTIYVGSAGSDYKLYAINPDGTEKWSFMAGGGVCSPVIDFDGTIYVGSSDNNLYAINPDGSEKWRFTTADNVQSAPAIDSNGIIYVGSHDDKLYAINPNGSERWSFLTGGNVGGGTSPAIGFDGTIYVGSDDYNLYAIYPDGTEKWSFTTGCLVQTAPAIGFDGTIFVGADDYNLYAINPDGTEKWSFTMGLPWVHSSPAIGSDGTIYIGSWDGNLYAINEGGIPPIAIAGPDQTIYEGSPVQLDASASYDPDGTIETYEWDFDSIDGLWWDASAVPDATDPTPTHVYGDDGVYIVTLRITDNDNLSATDICNVTVQNVDLTVTIESITMEVEIGLRVAGRKYNNVSMALYEDGSSLGYVSIERMPGSPDEQMAWIPVSINFSNSYSATVTYIPEDPPNVGGNPVWIYIKSKDGSINKIHHTFNVQQSKKRDSEHWNHVEPWEVDLNGHFIGLPFEITSHIIDPGSDDEILTFTYGSQNVEVTHFNNPPNPDPYPSPEVNPRDIYETVTLVYEGPGTVTLVAKDDDNIRIGIGQASDSIGIG